MLRLDWNLAFTILNILIWYVLIRKFLFKPINSVIDKREALIRSRYEEAQKLQDEAKEEKEKCETLQRGIEEDRSKVMTDAQKEARAEYSRILTDAQKKADQIVDASRKEAQLEKEKIVKKANQEIQSLIMETAEKSMQSKEDDGALYDQFLEKAGEADHAEH